MEVEEGDVIHMEGGAESAAAQSSPMYARE